MFIIFSCFFYYAPTIYLDGFLLFFPSTVRTPPLSFWFDRVTRCLC